MIAYIHGYNGSNTGKTSLLLKQIWPDIELLTYDQDSPRESLHELLEIIDLCDDDEEVIIIASSLGGFYAEEIAKRRIVDLVLLNPSLQPHISLAKYGVKEKVLSEYEELSSLKPLNKTTRRYVIVSEDDTVVRPEIALETYSLLGSGHVIKTVGGHRMTEEHSKIIMESVRMLQNTY